MKLVVEVENCKACPMRKAEPHGPPYCSHENILGDKHIYDLGEDKSKYVPPNCPLGWE